MTLKLYGRVRESIVDGSGIRYAVFVQGCPRACKGCHNPDSQPFEAGETVELDALLADILKNSALLSGITLSGGEPFSQAEALAVLAVSVKSAGLSVWTYTGYTLEELSSGASPENHWMDLLRATDVLVDGEFILSQRTLEAPYTGSANQRIINLKEVNLCDNRINNKEDMKNCGV